MLEKIPEAAKAIKIHPETLRRMIRAGRIPHYRFNDCIRIDIEEIKKCLRQESRTSSKSDDRIEP
jgi:excisionase family DNA binding protein